MNMRHYIALLLPLFLLAPACPPPPNPPTPDANDGGPPPLPPSKDAASEAATGDAAPPSALDAAPPDPMGCRAACSNLAALGCKEGQAASCAATCEHANGTLTDLKPTCLRLAKTKAAARACKSVECP